MIETIPLDKFSNSAFRLRRFSHFLDIVSRVPQFAQPLQILDLGGEEAYWSDKIDLIGRPVKITLLNRGNARTSRSEFNAINGDARSMPYFNDNSFDIVHSNSVIEHVGQWNDMKDMAREVRRLAPSYFVQTPYFWFPIEPHFRSLAFHWLPEPIRARKLMSRRHGFISKAQSLDDAMKWVQGSMLLDRRMFADLFPDARIVFEKIYGLPKSLMAIRDNQTQPKNTIHNKIG